MSVTLQYTLTGSGWAECILQVDEQQIRLTASYLSDALGNLLTIPIQLLKGYDDITISFDEEPGEYRWRVKPLHDEMISIQILEFDELWGHQPDEEGKTIFSATCRLRTFCGAVLSASQKVFEQYGFEGYKAKWVEYDFPLNRQQELQRLLKN